MAVKGEDDISVAATGWPGELANEELRVGQIGVEGEEYPPSSIEGELEILSIISSSMSSTSASAMSPSSALTVIPPFSLTACSSCGRLASPLNVVRSSSEPGSSRRFVVVLQLEFRNCDSSDDCSSATCRKEAS